MFTLIFALAFSFAVVALIGVGVTTGFDRLVDYAQDLRQRSVKSSVES